MLEKIVGSKRPSQLQHLRLYGIRVFRGADPRAINPGGSLIARTDQRRTTPEDTVIVRVST
jgi:hypothetical protein